MCAILRVLENRAQEQSCGNISLVKVVQNEKFLYKKCCQKFCLSENDKFNTSGHRILLKSTNDSQIESIW